MSDEIAAMNKNFNEKFDIMAHRMDDMSETLNSIKHSPTRGSKQRKELHSLPDIALYDTS
jgi:archaellum component FlaC